MLYRIKIHRHYIIKIQLNQAAVPTPKIALGKRICDFRIMKDPVLSNNPADWIVINISPVKLISDECINHVYPSILWTFTHLKIATKTSNAIFK